MVDTKNEITTAADADTGPGVEETAAAGQSQPDQDPNNQEPTTGGDTEDPPSPGTPKGKPGKKNGEKSKDVPPTDPAKPIRVRVICEGTLGPLLLEKGTETGHPDYVALLEVKGQKKVVLVK